MDFLTEFIDIKDLESQWIFNVDFTLPRKNDYRKQIHTELFLNYIAVWTRPEINKVIASEPMVVVPLKETQISSRLGQQNT